MPNSKQRREAERRRLQRQLERRQRREAARRRVTVLVSVIAVLAVVGIVVGFIVASGNDHPPQAGGAPTTHPSTAGAPTSTGAPISTGVPTSSGAPTSTAAAGTCTYTRGGTAARTVNLPPAKEPAKGTVKATVATSQGTMTFTLDRAHAPCTVGSFVSLAKQQYFAGTPCHRLTTSGIYVLQCGDPTGTGTGGPGYSFNDELTGKEKYTRGVLAMANSGPNTNGSQFFIVYKDSQLGPQYTVFGTVSSGLKVVDKVAKAGVQGGGSDGKPALPVTIKKVTVRA